MDNNGKCPNCGGTVVNGRCEYCDTVFSKEQTAQPEIKTGKKSGSPKLLLGCVIVFFSIFVVLPVIAVVFGGIVSDWFYQYDSSSYIKSSEARQAERADAFRKSGAWQYGTYKIGDEIPEGTYLAIHNGTDAYGSFTADICTDKECSSSISEDPWGNFSKYLELKAPYYVSISNCILYDIEKCDVENDPLKRSGMFLCGRDIAPGTYELTFDEHFEELYGNSYFCGDYKIYKDITADAPIMKDSGNFKEGVKITLSEGDYVILHACRIKG